MSAHQSHELLLEGCTPTPLAGYLKALGVLRLLGEQKPEWAVRGAWRDDRFVLNSPVFSGDEHEDRQRLQAFFLDEYRPTPIVAPWNGGSGFYPNDNKEGIDALCSSSSVRFAAYKELIEFSHDAVARSGLVESPKNEAKSKFLTAMRSAGPEPLLDWMDAAVLMAGDEPRYPPLLGTGGNDGRLDFTNNFMQRLKELFDLSSGQCVTAATSWLSSALFGDSTSGLAKAAIGQFNPGGAGGPNAGVGYDADSLINTWDFVLMLEGALLFAAAATRRLETVEPGMLSYPFTVRASGAGNGSMDRVDEGQARAEVWLPIWKGYSSAIEIKTLLTEGRATLERRPVRDGLGFVRAVATLGVDRGISSFQRYGFLMRSGKAYLATPLTRVRVSRSPETDLIEQLESGHFLDRLRQFARKDEAPARIRSHVRQLEDAIFELAQRSAPRTLQNVIIHIGALSQLLGKSRKAREAVPMPIPSLSEEWVLKADDGSAEFRMAAALAGLHGGGLPMRLFLTPVQQEKHGGWSWYPESWLVVWGDGDLLSNLGRVIDRRRLEALRQEDKSTPFQFCAGVSSGDVAAWINGEVHEARLAGLLSGLVHMRIPKHLANRGERAVLPAAYSVLKPFFAPGWVFSHFDLLPPDRTLSLPGELISRLQSGQVQTAVDIAWRRLQAVGYPLLPHPNRPPLAHGLNGPRLLAALAVPLALLDLAQCLRTVTRIPENESV